MENAKTKKALIEKDCWQCGWTGAYIDDDLVRCEKCDMELITIEDFQEELKETK